MSSRRECVFVVPGDLHTRTGGYRYDLRIIEGLRADGWRVQVESLPGVYPCPDAQARADADRIVRGLPDGACVVADGLAFGALPQLAQAHAQRLRWVALVHHPLWLETGLDATLQLRLRSDEATALRAARQIIVTSAATAVDVRALAGDGVEPAVIEPGTDAAGAARSRRPSAPVRLLCVASLTPRKGHAWLLQALAELQHLPWQLHLVGGAHRDAATAQELQHRCEALGLAQRVCWHGEADDTALAAHYAAADVFVMPSWHEGYGMALAEALVHGLPVVASSGVALALTLPPDAARVVTVGDVDALRDALAGLIESPAQRAACADAAHRAGQRLPSWQQAAQRFAVVLQRVQ